MQYIYVNSKCIHLRIYKDVSFDNYLINSLFAKLMKWNFHT